MRHTQTIGAALGAGAALLLLLGTPAVQAKYGGALLGGGTSSKSSGGAAYTPPPGSPVRKAILDAIRLKVGRASGKYVVFTVQTLRVEDGWARAVVRPQSAGGGTTYDRLAAVLAATGDHWKVVHIAEGASITTDPATLRRLYPYAPPGIF